MSFPSLSLDAWLLAGQGWTVPVAVGTGICLLAFVTGLWLLKGRPRQAAEEVDPDGQLDQVFLQGVTQDRRSAPRRKGNTVEVELSLNDDGPIFRGWVVDRSIGGLCILADSAVSEGAILRVRARTGGLSQPWTPTKVSNCRQEGIRYELGCQFVHVPSWGELLHFG